LMTTQLELLAPAGDADIGIAAIDHGADAVYIGAPKFSARAEAGVNLDDINRLIRHAHLYYAKAYVALNTILTDNEIPLALEIINEVYQSGADGLILQDVGLLELDLPPIPLIASTQMHNTTPEKVQFLESAGFKRVILARELSLDEIAAIRQETRIELESFVAGALCVSYSGQCYMSQAATGRSGNRGVCAQPCRSRYTLIDSDGKTLMQDKFLLSLKDLNLMKSIPDLVAAGITSFKIEGRYKGIDYVKNVTAAFRQAIDSFISGHRDFRRTSSGISGFTFSPDPEKTFNRGYTQYFIHGRKEKVASINTQKSIGQYLGKITGMGKNYLTIDCHDLQNGDGLCFFTAQDELAGFRVNRVERDKLYPNSMKDLEVGAALYRNYDISLSRLLKKSSANRKIAVEMDFIQEDKLIRLAATDEDGNQVETILENMYMLPQNPSRAREQIETQLCKTGNSPYHVRRLTIHPPQPGFLPVSSLNGMRRDVLEKLTKIRLEKYPRQNIPLVPNNAPYPGKRLDFRANVLNEHARQFYIRHGVQDIEPAFETLSDTTGKTVMTTRYCIRHQLDLCPKYNKATNFPKEPLRIRDTHHTYRIEFDCKNCRMFVLFEGPFYALKRL
jgi:23S rRNA 5-hydroxycytidine C2501 synthase